MAKLCGVYHEFGEKLCYNGMALYFGRTKTPWDLDDNVLPLPFDSKVAMGPDVIHDDRDEADLDSHGGVFTQGGVDVNLTHLQATDSLLLIRTSRFRLKSENWLKVIKLIARFFQLILAWWHHMTLKVLFNTVSGYATSIRPLLTHFSKIWINVHTFLFKEILEFQIPQALNIAWNFLVFLSIYWTVHSQNMLLMAWCLFGTSTSATIIMM